jgi:recombinational DNA repair ATPase RecF
MPAAAAAAPTSRRARWGKLSILMRAQSIRWSNFRAFRDTERMELPALTVLIGPNSSGKSSILAPLLLLKQTLEASESGPRLLTKGPLISAGSYSDLVFQHQSHLAVTLDLTFATPDSRRRRRLSQSPPARVKPYACHAGSVAWWVTLGLIDESARGPSRGRAGGVPRYCPAA